MSFAAFFDTNVLYGAYLTDFILRLAERGAFRPLWSEGVLEELQRNLTVHHDESAINYRIQTMRDHFPDAMVRGYEPLISGMTNDKKDRHVLAAAVRANAEVLVTFNTKDFPDSSVVLYEIEIVEPDGFLLDQLDLFPGLKWEHCAIGPRTVPRQRCQKRTSFRPWRNPAHRSLL